MTKPSHAESRYPAIPVGPRLEAVLELAYRLPFDVRALLADYTAGSALAKEIQGYRERGQTDRLDELVTRLVPLLEGPEAGVLIQKRQLSLAAFEAELEILQLGRRLRIDQGARRGEVRHRRDVHHRPEDLFARDAEDSDRSGDGPKPFVMAAPPRVRR